ncbi:MAG: thioesterase family protein [Actinomycetota bacterium]|nr:thioesterase family protein [Actinomycetota bacterium]
MRWADLDMLGHVNNVTYVDYLQEARIDMLAAHAPVQGGERLAEGVVVVRHEVQFRSPLVYRLKPVRIECWVTEVKAATFTMAYEIFDENDGERVVYLRATTVLTPYVFAEERPRRISREERGALSVWLDAAGFDRSPAIPPRPEAGGRHEFQLWVRWSDVDAYGHVNNVKYFEFFQEARIQYMFSLPREEDGPWSQWVVAQTDVDYLRPIMFGLEPYGVHSWISHVGEKSTVLVGEIRDGDQVLARSRVVMVAFDKDTQRSGQMNPAQRQRLADEIA